MDYAALIKRLSRRGLFHIEPGLDRIHAVLKVLGTPQDAVKTIHIAGTNGKGSVAASLESVLRHAGFRTGLYTSPHLWDVRERIQIDRRPISPSTFFDMAQRVLAAEREVGFALTYFEFLTAMSFVAFAQKSVDIAIVEVGMGGRWDATNVILHPELTVITSIGLDHTQWLGRTESQIAREKAGIIKSGSPLISGVRGRAALVIKTEARRRKAPLYRIDDDFRAETRQINWESGTQSIQFRGPSQPSKHVLINFVGDHQTDNAAVTLSAIGLLQKRGWTIPERAIQSGLAGAVWPGRFQQTVSAEGTRLIFDGAHNPPALKRFLDTLNASPWRKASKIFVFSAYRDKDYPKLLKMIRLYADTLILCTMPGSRALPARKQYETAIKTYRCPIRVVADPQTALQTALRTAGKKDLVIVTGSLTLVGILLQEIKKSAERTTDLKESRMAAYV